jgi:hypothetical protein
MPGRNVEFRLAGSSLGQYRENEKRKDRRGQLSNILLALQSDIDVLREGAVNTDDMLDAHEQPEDRWHDPTEWFCRGPALMLDDGRRAMIYPVYYLISGLRPSLVPFVLFHNYRLLKTTKPCVAPVFPA